MRLLLHDHSGHSFQVALSRELAARGHVVLHVHASSFATAKGRLTRSGVDPPTFSVEGMSHGSPFRKYSFRRRVVQEVGYGRRFVGRAEAFGPDVMVVCNTPLLSQDVITRWAARRNVGCIVWLQDLYSVAVTNVIRQRSPMLVRPAVAALERLEAVALRRCDRVVAISEGFRPALERWRVPRDHVRVVANWAPIEELPVREKRSPWAIRHQLHDRFVFLYTGTLGLKHDPGLLVSLAEHWAGDPEVVVVVVSEGMGADWLTGQAGARGLENLRVLAYQPHEVYAEVMGAADVLVAILDEEAGRYSVPSKVASYHCAARPVLAVMPEDNDAARMIREAGSGIVVPAGHRQALLAASERLRAGPELRGRHGARGRAFAEANFDLASIASRFEQVMDEASACHDRTA